MKNVLFIVGLAEHYYFQPFLDACEKKEIQIYICDPSRYPTDASLHVAQYPDGRINGFLDVVQLKKNLLLEKRIALSDIQIAWYLRESNKQGLDELGLEARFAYNETRQALRAVFSLLDCKWVNQRESIERVNSNKLYQQAIAARSGLSIPPTIISNDPTKVLEFCTEGRLLLKSIGCVKLDDLDNLALYSELFFHEELKDGYAAIQICPVYSQKYIEKRYEYRVMVMGDQVLSCRIDSQSSELTKIDWRHYDFDHVKHEQVVLPQDIQQKLLQFMRMVDLRFGAIDLIETKEGDFIFLEVNPSGQWGWIAELANIPIPEAVSNMLLSL